MASFGFLLLVLAISPVVAAAALAAFLGLPSQRIKPGPLLVGVSVLPALASLVIVVLLVRWFGSDGISALTLGLAIVSWGLVWPILRRAFRRA